MYWLASVAQSVVHLTRNEKVACSSQVTSSIKRTNPCGWFFLYSELTRSLARRFSPTTRTELTQDC